MSLVQRREALEQEQAALEAELADRAEKVNRIVQAHNIRTAQIGERLAEIRGGLKEIETMTNMLNTIREQGNG